MNKLFFIQLAASFVVGGTGITLLTFIAEHSSARDAGIVLAFPSTGALSFFFLGWAVSPEAVAHAVPATFIPLGLTVLFPVIYTYVAHATSGSTANKAFRIILTFSLSTLFWFAFALPAAIFKLSNLSIGIAGYAVLAVLAHVLLSGRKYSKSTALSYTAAQKIGRAAFVGFVVVTVVFLGKRLDIFWGEILAMFPAAFSSTIMVLHWYYGPESLFAAARKIPIGSLSICVYSVAAMYSFPKFGFVIGTIIYYAASVVVTLVLLDIQRADREISRTF